MLKNVFGAGIGRQGIAAETYFAARIQMPVDNVHGCIEKMVVGHAFLLTFGLLSPPPGLRFENPDLSLLTPG